MQIKQFTCVSELFFHVRFKIIYNNLSVICIVFI